MCNAAGDGVPAAGSDVEPEVPGGVVEDSWKLLPPLKEIL